MLVVFIIDNDIRRVYITTPDKYSQALVALGVDPDRVTFQNITLESIMLLSEGQGGYLEIRLYR